MKNLKPFMIAALVAAALLLGLLTGATWYASKKLTEATRGVVHTLEVLNTLEQIKGRLAQAESAQRGYFLQAAPALLQERDNALDAAAAGILAIELLTVDNAAQGRRIVRLRDLFQQQSAVFADSQALQDATGPMAKSAYFSRSAALQAGVRELTDRIKEQEVGLLAERNADEMVRAERVRASFALLLAFFLAALGVLASRIRRDIGRQQQAAETLRIAHEELDTRQAARNAAETANRGMAEFLANMSHEIRSPLNAILGLAYLLERAPLDFDAHNMVRRICASGRTLLAIVNDILDLSKVESGHMLLEQAPFRLADVLDRLAGSMTMDAASKNLELCVAPAPAGIVCVLGDALRLEQVLSNLTSNAIKFTPSGRVELGCELLARDGAQVVLRFCVRDTGVGIAPELQDAMFAPFTQGDSSTTRRFGGTGLGLAICRRLVRLMGGEITLNSRLGQGSEFCFTLPLQVVAGSEFPAPDQVGIEVLVAAEPVLALPALAASASSLGWRVTGVASFAAVLAHMLEQMPGVVILERELPGMDALAALRALRAGIAQDDWPIVILAAAHAHPGLASEPGADMLDAILGKPVSAAALYHAVVEARRARAAAPVAAAGLLPAAKKGLDGVRLLVVDDSEINRDVARRILAEHGAMVTLAVDGRAALDWLLAHPDEVDLVLMDLQMPVMDGIETTRQLRLLPQFDDLPIVALTAGAFEAQQQAARAAGMNHFISKPFDVPSTIALIRRIRREGAAAAAPAPAPAPSGLALMDVAHGLELWSNGDTYREYLRHFAASYANAVALMNASLAAADVQAAAALAHKLAGVAANLALPGTHRLAGEVERLLHAGGDPAPLLARLDHELEQVMLAIAQFAPPAVADTSVPAPPPDAAALGALFAGLLSAIDGDNPSPVETILSTMETQFPAHQLATIRDCVRGFDFRGAQAGAIALARMHGIILRE